ncbi:hypothetical protein [Methylobacterium platani]|uniref:Uncharacterized protein n=2 Tax=Methylobacterium platani TaxID=427683 RepID=A0A179SI25_9HYPH|nr:hypothetical protein [Methylobacterium platani]KMO12548.1 hypothetical protein SQ03_24090 [Methylobacterium platani JCM 14648]OAS26640.1 hypothetical protein A5481_04085 [Methylobacterium platani]
MARDMIKLGANRQVHAPPGSMPDRVEAGINQPSGETILRERPDNLSVLLDIIDSMPADMLSDLHDGLPDECDDL